MDNYGGREPTGRRVRGPVSELVELEPKSEDDVIHTAIVYDEPFHGHSALSDNVRLALNFMEYPMVAGLAELADHDIDKAWYVYATGASRSVAEVLKSYRDIGQTVGERAAMELCYLAAMAIGEAGESGPTQGVYSHGDLSPWRILVQEDGQVLLIGHGIPQVEVLEWRADPDSHKLREESFHYTPPERIEGAPEDPVADIYSLALIAFECITGKTLFQGNADKVLKQARHAEGPQLVQKEKKIPGPIRDLLEQCLQFDPNNRPSPDEFIAVLYDLLSAGLSGDPLGDVVQRVFGAKSRGRALRSADGETSVIPRRAVQGAGGRRGGLVRGGVRAPTRAKKGVEEDDGGRWGKVARGRGSEDEEPEEEEETGGRRRRRRKTDDDDSTSSRRSRRRRKTDDDAEEEADSALRRRRRRRASSDDDDDSDDSSDTEAESTDDDSADDEDSGSSRRRRRRTTADDDSSDDDSSTSRRRRRRSASSDDSDDDSSDDDDSGSTRRRRRRSSSSDDDADDAKSAKDDSSDDDSGSTRRRRRRSSSSDDDADDAKSAKEDSADDDDDSGSTRRRRRRSSSSDDDAEDAKSAKDDSADDDDSGSTRRRRRRSSSDDDAKDDAKSAKDDSSDDDDSGSTRRRRRRSSSDDDAKDDAKSAKDDSADDDDSGSTRRRRRRSSSDDDAKDDAKSAKDDEKKDTKKASSGRTRRKSRRKK